MGVDGGSESERHSELVQHRLPDGFCRERELRIPALEMVVAGRT